MSDINPTQSTLQNEEENYEQKCLCVLVLDTSGSMNANDAIGELNRGLQTFKEETMQDKVTKDRLELAIVSFNSTVEIMQQPDLLTNVQMPTLQASGQTHLVDAVRTAQQVVEERKQYYKSMGIPYYRPWIVVMTDGDPYPAGQDLDGLSAEIQADAASKKYVFIPIGIGSEVQDAVLSKLATKDLPAVRMGEVKFNEFFQWLSSSMSVVVAPTNNDDGGNQITTPAPTDWGTGFVINTDVN